MVATFTAILLLIYLLVYKSKAAWAKSVHGGALNKMEADDL